MTAYLKKNVVIIKKYNDLMADEIGQQYDKEGASTKLNSRRITGWREFTKIYSSGFKKLLKSIPERVKLLIIW